MSAMSDVPAPEFLAISLVIHSLIADVAQLTGKDPGDYASAILDAALKAVETAHIEGEDAEDYRTAVIYHLGRIVHPKSF